VTRAQQNISSADSSERSGWLEIAVETHPVAHEALSAFFFDLGCHGVVSQSFHDSVFRAYLPQGMDSKQVRAKIGLFLKSLESIFPETRSAKVSFNMIERQDWSRLWRKHYRPLRVSERLTVFPAWESPPPGFKGITIRIDPGPAFGTGQHATTQMCLKAIEECAHPTPWTMLDVGTGSGILAVYGAKLGAESVLALENDPEALRWAERNIALNNVSRSIHLSSVSPREIEEPFTMVAANLILDTILELIPSFCRLVEPEGSLILSGLLKEQTAEVHEALAQEGFRSTQVLQEQEWACMVARRTIETE
jgi:ribosomal protein L11 methyltransferase